MATTSANRMLSLENPVKAWRIEQDKTLEAAATDLGVSREGFRRWETGEDIPTDRRLVKLAKLMAVPAAELYEKLREYQDKVQAAATAA